MYVIRISDRTPEHNQQIFRWVRMISFFRFLPEELLRNLTNRFEVYEYKLGEKGT